MGRLQKVGLQEMPTFRGQLRTEDPGKETECRPFFTECYAWHRIKSVNGSQVCDFSWKSVPFLVSLRI